MIDVLFVVLELAVALGGLWLGWIVLVEGDD